MGRFYLRSNIKQRNNTPFILISTIERSFTIIITSC
jgi:hypothetical protein